MAIVVRPCETMKVKLSTVRTLFDFVFKADDVPLFLTQIFAISQDKFDVIR